MTEIVTITALGHAGDGIAEGAEGRIFVPLTLPGEVAEVERSGNRGRLVRILTASPLRVSPVCRHFGECGGCALEHMERAAYLAWKHEVVHTSFALHGIDAPVAPMVAAAQPGGRRRAVLSAIRTGRGIALGYHRRQAHEIVPISECAVLSPAIVSRLPLLREIAAVAIRSKREARVTVLAADNGLDIAVEGNADSKTLAALGRFGVEMAIARLTVGGAEVFRNRAPELAAGSAALLPTPGGFVQAVAAAEAALADAALAFVGNAAPVADLFAGIGTFSLRLAARAAVTAVESDPALLAALEAATRRASGLKRITTLRRDLFVNPLAPPELDRFGAVVFDPPAAGAKAQAEMLARSRVAKVVAVSCNPATLARDARILIDGGYRLTGVTPVDQFLFSAEIEAVATFGR